MMDMVSRDELDALIDVERHPAVSIYMPTHEVGESRKQDPIRYGNLLAEAGRILDEQGLRRPQIEALLDPARRLAEEPWFKTGQSRGLAVFLGEDGPRRYRVPIDVPELAVVGERFHLKPLLRLFAGDGAFHLLAVAQGGVRLYQGSREALMALPAEGLPRDLADALRYDEPLAQLQFHTGATGRGGSRDAIWHGQGVGVDDAKNRILRYFQRVDDVLRSIWRDTRLPLVLAGVQYLHPIFREASSYPNILAQGIAGNPDAYSPVELHARAWAIVRPVYQAERDRARERFDSLADHPERRTASVPEIVLAAHDGRIDTLFVAVGRQRWGTFDAVARRVVVHEGREVGDHDLLDLAARFAFRQGGTVHAVDAGEVPGESDAAAVLRF